MIRHGLVVLLVLCVACESERKEPPACVSAREAVSTYTALGELEQARAQLAVAKQTCGKASEYAIDRLERGIEREQRHVERNARLLSKDDQSPLTPFIEWARREREEKDRAKGQHSCAPAASPDYGFCTSQILQPGAAPFVVRYWRSEPDDAFMFSWSLEQPVSCVDTGPHRVVDQWTAGTEKLQLCELTDHTMRGLKALLRQEGTRTQIQVFSNGYLRRDAAMADELEHLVRP